MLPDKEFDTLDEALKVVLEQGATRVSYGTSSVFRPEVGTWHSSYFFSFEKSCQVPIAEELKRVGHPGTVSITCSVSQYEWSSKWYLSQWVEGTGGSMEIDPERPGIALGAAFVQHEIKQIALFKQAKISSETEVKLIGSMSENLSIQWTEGVFNQMSLHYAEKLKDENFPSHELLEEAYLKGSASLDVDKINQREYIFLGIRYFCHYEWGRGVRLFGSKGGWQVHEARSEGRL